MTDGDADIAEALLSMCLQLRLRLPFLIIFLLGINCLFFVRYNTYRTFQVHSLPTLTHHASCWLCWLTNLCSDPAVELTHA